MRIRLADYVADFLVNKGVTDVFSVVGGGAMHLNDALGHKDGLHVTYNHHEQACAIAAESYARLENRIAAVCVTTGPGGTNALTGVLGGWLDSIPMFVISGQVRYDTTARFALQYTGSLLRAMGDQEYDIVKSVAPMTKYAVMIEDPLTIKYHLERAWHLATTGRPGPVWIDIPVNFQGMYIETEELAGVYDSKGNDTLRPVAGVYDSKGNDTLQPAARVYNPDEDDALLPPAISEEVVREVIRKIKSAKRPVFYAGYGIRLAGAYDIFRKVLEKLNIPVVTYWNAIDLIEDEHPLYVGRAGNMGDRPGNWAIQNADLILAVGTRISIRQVGYNWKTWARAAEVIMVDIDQAELKKPTLHVEKPIWADAKDFLQKMEACLDLKDFASECNPEQEDLAGKCNPEQKNFASECNPEQKDLASECNSEQKDLVSECNSEQKDLVSECNPEQEDLADECNPDWNAICLRWKQQYPVVLPRQLEENGETANVYAFVKYLSSRLPENSLTAVSNGACCVVGHQAYEIQKGSRFTNNSAVASMGYGLPAAIGMCIGGRHLLSRGSDYPTTNTGSEKRDFSATIDRGDAAESEVACGGKDYPTTICLEGDGSIMMNLQELQTILTNRLPIKIFLINNSGYHSIRITQSNLFSEHTKVGIGEESGDLSFPQFEKLAKAFGYPYLSASSNQAMREAVGQALAMEGPVFCEIFTDTKQVWEPKSSTKRLEDGTLVSPPLEDLAPFLPKEELEKIMLIPMVEEDET